MYSVIIPLFNKEKYIAKTIQSVLNQTFTNYELIIVNDGSTDNSLKIIEQTIKTLSKDIIIINQPNQGVSVARNNGVKAAKYEYIAFLDADDWWNSNFLKLMQQTILQCPDAAIYGNRFYIIKNGRNHLSNVGIDDNFDIGYIDYIKTYSNTFCTPFNCSFVVVKKSIFLEEKGFNPELKFGEDFDLWIRIALKHKVAYLNTPLSYSNQDVAIKFRALDENKMYPKETFFIFNLGYLEKEEKNNPLLKVLLDGLRVRSLLRYHLAKKYEKEVTEILNKINWEEQPVSIRRNYTYPIEITRLYNSTKLLGSFFKNKIIRIINAKSSLFTWSA